MSNISQNAYAIFRITLTDNNTNSTNMIIIMYIYHERGIITTVKVEIDEKRNIDVFYYK